VGVGAAQAEARLRTCAAGCLIYSDPRDDGYGAGDTYPKGGYRPRDGVQRGSVQDMVLYSGDPLTPGVGATTGAKRLAIQDAKTILRFPCCRSRTPQPSRCSPRSEAGWRRPAGAAVCPHLSSGTGSGESASQSAVGLEAKDAVRRHCDAARRTRTGSVDRSWQSSRWLGIRRDRSIGRSGSADGRSQSDRQIVQRGWRPRRTLIYASWDGEEAGLLGSTEWAELHAMSSRPRRLSMSIPTRTAAAFSVRAQPCIAALRERSGARCEGSRDRASVLARAVAKEHIAHYDTGAHGSLGSISSSARSAPARTSRPSCSTWE